MVREGRFHLIRWNGLTCQVVLWWEEVVHPSYGDDEHGFLLLFFVVVFWLGRGFWRQNIVPKERYGEVREG
jgi:hypothetical protein